MKSIIYTVTYSFKKCMLWTFPYILLFYNILRDYIDIAPIPGDLFCLQIMIKHAVLNYFVHKIYTHIFHYFLLQITWLSPRLLIYTIKLPLSKTVQFKIPPEACKNAGQFDMAPYCNLQTFDSSEPELFFTCLLGVFSSLSCFVIFLLRN